LKDRFRVQVPIRPNTHGNRFLAPESTCDIHTKVRARTSEVTVHNAEEKRLRTEEKNSGEFQKIVKATNEIVISTTDTSLPAQVRIDLRGVYLYSKLHPRRTQSGG
jgi:hypothetical protein